jgi:rhodanese-related sulfurtransferase
MPAPTPIPLSAQGLPPHYPFKPEWEVTPRQVKAMQEQQADCLFIDCRTPQEWDLVRLPGTTLIPLQQWSQHLEDLEEHKDRPIIIHCHHGIRSLQMAMLLRQQGFAQTYSLAGGIDLWAIDIDPTLKRY